MFIKIDSRLVNLNFVQAVEWKEKDCEIWIRYSNGGVHTFSYEMDIDSEDVFYEIITLLKNRALLLEKYDD